MPIIDYGNPEPGSRRRNSTPLDKTENAQAGYGLCWAKASYLFATEGGAIATIGLLALPASAGATKVPSGSLVLGGFVDVVTPPDSAAHTATIALQIESAGDLVAAAAVSGAPWSTAGRKSILPVFTGASAIKLTADRDISAVIATQALNAGAFDVYLCYLPPSDP